ncbi:MAG TPA: methionyl-tRNA formyltransferase [bacterium]|nr:methionyl-tRNA formyltransferase [bacterium]
MSKPLADPRVLFLGSPPFALPSLRALEAATTLVGVISQPDRPAGRGRRVAAPAVARYARERGLPLWQPPRLRTPAAIQRITDLAPDVLVTVAYGRIIPAEVLAIPPLGALNAHPSLLPAYRGASPIQRAIADGQTETGVTIIFQTEALDAGDIILQQRVAIGPEETAGQLETRLADLAAGILLEAVRLVAEGRAPRRAQEEAAATYVGKLTKEHGRIDWRQPARAIASLVRAMDPWPSAYTTRGGGLLKIWGARPTEMWRLPPEEAAPAPGGRLEPGTVLAVSEEGILLQTGDGALSVLEVQPEGGRRMDAGAYARGHRVRAGERWGAPDLPGAARALC